GSAIWCAIAMASYIVGLSCFARFESRPGPMRFWPVILLLAPVALALLLDNGPYREKGLLLSAPVLLWGLKSLRYTLAAEHDVGRTIAGLLAGIVFVDWLALAHAPRSEERRVGKERRATWWADR